MKNLYILLIIWWGLTVSVCPHCSYADGEWGHHGEHHYFRYHDRPHFGLRVPVFYPDEYFPVRTGGVMYYYDDGVYYNSVGGQYAVVAPPVGAVVNTIPVDFHPVFINGVTYYTDNGEYYIHTPNGYMVVSPPQVQATSLGR